MPSEKRQRQDEGRLNRRIAEQAATRRRQRSSTARNVGIAVVLLLAVLFGYSKLTGGDDSETVDSAATSTTVAGDTSTTAAGTATTEAAGSTEPGPAIGTTECPPEGGAKERTTTFSSGPKACIDVDKTYTATMKTSKGTIKIELDAKAAPKAVNSFVFLARNHYYDGVAFHRIIPGFVVQGGDANGNPPGTGGPGYTFADELPTGAAPYYELGSLAMANSGANTNGSQFFIVVADQSGTLPKSYTIFGHVTSGMDVVDQIVAAPRDSGDFPNDPIPMTTVTVAPGPSPSGSPVATAAPGLTAPAPSPGTS
jgi:cyclophilin family peptidyl-prolyl cis-trans isomerase